MYLKLQNTNLVGHAVVEDMERLKEYMQKLKEVESGQKPTLKLDKAAAKRFISSALKPEPVVQEEPASENEEDEE